MNKTELIAAIAEKSGLSKVDAGSALDAMLTTVGEQLANNGSVSLIGFGTFKVTERAARNGRNPKTGETITIPASKTASFKAGSQLKQALGGE